MRAPSWTCAAALESEDDAARREAIDCIRMLVGKLLPIKVYTSKGLVQTPDGQQYRGMGCHARRSGTTCSSATTTALPGWPTASSKPLRNAENDFEEVVENDDNLSQQSDEHPHGDAGSDEQPDICWQGENQVQEIETADDAPRI